MDQKNACIAAGYKKLTHYYYLYLGSAREVG